MPFASAAAGCVKWVWKVPTCLRSGWKADIVGVRIPPGASRVPERILSDEASVVLTMVDGKVCYQAAD